jgi:hypothetical protein
LLGIADVVGRGESHLLPAYAASSINVGYGHFRAALQLLTDPRKLSGDRAGRSDQHLGPNGIAQRDCKESEGEGGEPAHGLCAI